MPFEFFFGTGAHVGRWKWERTEVEDSVRNAGYTYAIQERKYTGDAINQGLNFLMLTCFL